MVSSSSILQDKTDPSVYYYHNDHLATPQKMTDGTGAVVWSADYKPFDEATITISTITNNLRFPGQYYDAETGLNYNYFRDYNFSVGRYAEADPLLLPLVYKGKNYFIPPYYAKNPSKLHDYLYVNGNPIKYKDPFGLSEGWTWGNGNIWPFYERQDGVCSSPAQIFNNNPDLLQCCREHDDCYARNRCNWTTWGTICIPLKCQECNLTAIWCFLTHMPIPDDNLMSY